MSKSKSTQKKPTSNKKGTSQNQEFSWYPFIFSLTAIALLILGIFQFGVVGLFIYKLFRILLGQYPQIFMILKILVLIIFIFRPKGFHMTLKRYIVLGLSIVIIMLIQALLQKGDLVGLAYINNYLAQVGTLFNDLSLNAYSGIIGSIVYGAASYLFGREGTMIFIVLFSVIIVALLYSPQQVVETVSETTEDAIKQSRSLMSSFKNRPKKVKKKQEASLKSYDEMIAENFEDDSNLPQIKVKDDAQKSLFISYDENEGQPINNEISQSEVAPRDSAVENTVDSDGEVIEKPSPLPTTYENYKLPSIHLLDGVKGRQGSSLNSKAAKEKADRLIEVLKQFGIDAQLIDIHIGPAVTKFELKPDSNVKISKISSVQDNLMMELAVKTLRIEAPIPGKSAVGIEVPNEELVPVGMKDIILKSPQFKSDKDVNVTLGKDLTGKPIMIALNKMPHLLIAGATGSGKSVSINSIITSILLSKKPDELKLLLIDPKKVEFAPFVNIPHLIGPVISDPMLAAAALNVVVKMMDERYDTFSKAGVRNIAGFNEKVLAFPEENYNKMPWIIVIIDELADLMSVAGKDVETSIQRITQLARAAGIHLIVATQRPSVDVVTGVIKANIPSRIAFSVSSAIDSRTILDTTGAEKLLGYGDMLYVPMGEPHPIRVQGVYVSDEEVAAIAQRASEQAAPTFEDDFIAGTTDSGAGIVANTDDPLYIEAEDYVIANQKASTSLLQRRFKVGYNRAANLMDALEQNGIVGPAQGSRPRLILKQDPNSEPEDTNIENDIE